MNEKLDATISTYSILGELFRSRGNALCSRVMLPDLNRKMSKSLMVRGQPRSTHGRRIVGLERMTHGRHDYLLCYSTTWLDLFLRVFVIPVFSRTCAHTMIWRICHDVVHDIIQKTDKAMFSRARGYARNRWLAMLGLCCPSTGIIHGCLPVSTMPNDAA